MPQPTEESYDALLAERMRLVQELEEERVAVTALEQELEEERVAFREMAGFSGELIEALALLGVRQWPEGYWTTDQAATSGRNADSEDRFTLEVACQQAAGGYGATLEALEDAKSEKHRLQERLDSLELTLSTMMEVLGWERDRSYGVWASKIPGDETTFYTSTPVDAARMAGDLIHDQRERLSFFAEQVEAQSSQLESYEAQVNRLERDATHAAQAILRLTRERDQALAKLEARA